MYERALTRETLRIRYAPRRVRSNCANQPRFKHDSKGVQANLGKLTFQPEGPVVPLMQVLVVLAGSYADCCRVGGYNLLDKTNRKLLPCTVTMLSRALA